MTNGEMENKEWKSEKLKIRKLYSDLIKLGDFPKHRMERLQVIYCFNFFEIVAKFENVSVQYVPIELKEQIEKLNHFIRLSQKNPYYSTDLETINPLNESTTVTPSSIFLLRSSNFSTLEIILNYQFKPFVTHYRSKLLSICEQLL